jgi:hypothetical protein
LPSHPAIQLLRVESEFDQRYISRLHHTPPAALRSLCLIFQGVQMREIFAGIPTVWQRCASPINSCQSRADKQFVQVIGTSPFLTPSHAREKAAVSEGSSFFMISTRANKQRKKGFLSDAKDSRQPIAQAFFMISTHWYHEAHDPHEQPCRIERKLIDQLSQRPSAMKIVRPSRFAVANSQYLMGNH